MKVLKLCFLTLLLVAAVTAQDKPKISFEDLMISAEQNFQNIYDARKVAEANDIPYAIYLPEGIFIDALGVEDGQTVYAVYYNLSNPMYNGETAFFHNIQAVFDLSNARLHYTNGKVINPNLGIPEVDPEASSRVVSFVMIPESTNDRVMTFDATSGDLIEMDYIPSDPTHLATPIEASLTPAFTILISDQVNDAVLMYDTSGVFLQTFFGGNTTILDNIRGTAFTPGFASLTVTVYGGANADAIAEFDPYGTYVGNFIANGAGGLSGPWDIIFRTSDCLVSASGSSAIHQYDLAGTTIGIFSAIDNYPEQITKFPNDNIGVGVFSGTQNGVVVLSPTGTLLNYFTGVAGVRGVYQLGNGNILATNGSGVHEIDGTTGTLVRTIVPGVSGRFISPFDPEAVPVELTSFTANVANGNVVLSWATATETNNSGFGIERSEDNVSFTNIGFIPGFGTTTEPKSYSYTDQFVNNGTYYYRLKQIDFDGSFTYSGTVEAEVSVPTNFALKQNYPNPFNPTTSIRFSLPVDAQVTIGVYNLVGEKVSEIASGNFSAGSHNVTFDASKLTSGVYFYRLDATGFSGKTFSSVKKMTLMK